MKFKRGINLYLEEGQSVTIPDGEIWVGYFNGTAYIAYGKAEKYKDNRDFFHDGNRKYKATLPGPMVLNTVCPNNPKALGKFAFMGLAFTAD